MSRKVALTMVYPSMDVFPDQIISEFLVRLPAKDVCRFKTVSKRWNSLIRTPHFITSFLSYSNPSWFIFDRSIRITRTRSDSNPAIRFNLTPRPGVSIITVNPLLISPNEPVILNYPGNGAQILQSSNGLVLFAVQVHCFLKDTILNIEDTSLFVTNPVTREWAPIPIPEYLPIDMLMGVGFVTRVRVDTGTALLDKFVVVEYQHLVDTNTSILQCFSSDTGKWATKKANYMLPPQNQHPFRPYWGFEFDERMFWIEYSVGLITWDVNVDIFSDCETVEEAKCRLIPLPKGRETPFTTMEMLQQRRFGGVGGAGRCLQYVELFKESDSLLKCWRLKDYKNPISEWKLMYKVSRLDAEKCLRRGCGNLITFNFHPQFEPDCVFFDMGEFYFSFNFRTRKVEGCAKSCGRLCRDVDYVPFVIPRWPVSIPPRFYASYAKEEGNKYFKEKNFTKAIECYSKSIALVPNVVAYANRAMAYLKIKSFCKAEDDCTEALKIDNNHVKVYARRAVARKEVGNLEGSKEDAEFALKLEPSNQDVKNLFAEVKSLLDKASSA